MDLTSSLLVIGGSALSFKVFNTIIRFLPTPEAAQKKAWKWRNICTSLAHSALTGGGAALCFYLQPWMMEDLMSSYSLQAHTFVAASIGYFIHDVLDLVLNLPFKQSWEVLLHHSMVICCFGFAVKCRLFLGFAVVSLLVEINSVFLHIRQLLLLSGRTNRLGSETTGPRPSIAYSIISWTNLATLLVFRMGTLTWMTRWVFDQREHMSRYVLMLATAGLTLISTVSAVLFYRVFRADILSINTGKKH